MATFGSRRPQTRQLNIELDPQTLSLQEIQLAGAELRLGAIEPEALTGKALYAKLEIGEHVARTAGCADGRGDLAWSGLRAANRLRVATNCAQM